MGRWKTSCVLNEEFLRPNPCLYWRRKTKKKKIEPETALPKISSDWGVWKRVSQSQDSLSSCVREGSKNLRVSFTSYWGKLSESREPVLSNGWIFNWTFMITFSETFRKRTRYKCPALWKSTIEIYLIEGNAHRVNNIYRYSTLW
jgi:hypothetical protein